MVIPLYLSYLLLPILLVALGSFGQSWTNSLLPSGFTLRWFQELLADGSFRRAFWTSLYVALGTCVATALLATPLGAARGAPRPQEATPPSAAVT